MERSGTIIEEFVCEVCGNACSSFNIYNICWCLDVKKVKLVTPYPECLCMKCGYVTHVHEDFQYCPNCRTVLQHKVKNSCDNNWGYADKGGQTSLSTNEPYIIVSQTSSINYWHDKKDITTEVRSAGSIVFHLRIAKSKNRPVFGIVNTKGEVLVEFIYDYIQPFRYTCLPGPGPLPPIERWFIGAFFTLGDNVGYLRIYEDGHIGEYGTCSREEYEFRCKLS